MSISEPCFICHEVGRYQCPACSIRTCSMACSKQHKAQTGCTGVPPVSHSVGKKLSQLAHSDIVSDLDFLTTLGTVVQKARKQSFQSSKTHHNETTRLLLRAAGKRHIELKTMPPQMAKRRRNTSYYHCGSDVIFWRVEFQLHLCATSADGLDALAAHCLTVAASLPQPLATPPDAPSSTLPTPDAPHSLDSSTPIYIPSSPSYALPTDIASSSLSNPPSSTSSTNPLKSLNKIPFVPPVLHSNASGLQLIMVEPRLTESQSLLGGFLAHLQSVLDESPAPQPYHPILSEIISSAAFQSTLQFYLRLESTADVDARYFLLDPQSSVTSALQHHSILEFPTFHVLLPPPFLAECTHFPLAPQTPHQVIP